MVSDFFSLASSIGQALHDKNLQIVTAESCTGGWLAEVLTSVFGASSWFDRGFITYSSESKIEMLGVSQNLISQSGVVSESVVEEMALGALKNSKADVSIAITGVAGPTGGTDETPVGTVWFGLAITNQTVQTSRQLFQGNRTSIREQAVEFALQKLVSVV